MTSTSLNLATSSYRRFTPDMGTPIQASNGRPRYRTPYTLHYALPSVYPSWTLMRAKTMPMAEFDERYRRDLDRVGFENIRQSLQAIADRTGGSRLVLLCFEATPDKCHRGSFARWWEDYTGQVVPEGGIATTPPPAPTHEQLAFNFEEM